MQGDEEEECEGEVEGRALIEAGRAPVLAARRLEREHGVVELAGQRVEDEEGRHVGEVHPEGAVLRVCYVLCAKSLAVFLFLSTGNMRRAESPYDLAAGNPSWRKNLLKLVVTVIRGCEAVSVNTTPQRQDNERGR